MKKNSRIFIRRFCHLGECQAWDLTVGFKENFQEFLLKVFHHPCEWTMRPHSRLWRELFKSFIEGFHDPCEWTWALTVGFTQIFNSFHQKFSSPLWLSCMRLHSWLWKKKFINHFFTPISVERLKVGLKRGFYKNNFHQLYFFFTPLSVKRSQIEFEESFYKKIS